MRKVLMFALAAIVRGSAAYAQETHGYVQGAGGFSRSTGVDTGNATGEVGFRVAPNIVVFGNIGRFADMESSALQSSVDSAVNTLAANDLLVTGTTRNPAWYSLGGARIELGKNSRVTPYAFGGVGVAHLNPSAKFLYVSGTPLSGNDTAAGADVTADVVSNGLLTQPVSTTDLMLRPAGGVEIPLGKHLLGNVGYSVSRISADSPVHAQDVIFGMGIKF